jgi:hypothetical protein
MNLFDRYFVILAGRMNGCECGAIATIADSGDVAIRLSWPLDFPEEQSSLLHEVGASNWIRK